MLAGDSLFIMIITKQLSLILIKSSWIQCGMLLTSPFLRAMGKKFAANQCWCKEIKASFHGVLHIATNKPLPHGECSGNAGKYLLKLL